MGPPGAPGIGPPGPSGLKGSMGVIGQRGDPGKPGGNIRIGAMFKVSLYCFKICLDFIVFMLHFARVDQ